MISFTKWWHLKVLKHQPGHRMVLSDNEKLYSVIVSCSCDDRVRWHDLIWRKK